MALIEWTPALSVGVAELDNQHKKLIDIINRFNDAMKSGKGAAVLAVALKEVADYTVYHFGAEERQLQAIGYSGLLKQKTEHKIFVDKLKSLQKELDAGKMMLSIEFMAFLKTWLTSHIAVNDKQYMPALNAKGIH
jgi:hemerythrin-like metal-binding protein